MKFEDTVAIYDALVAHCPGFERKGKSMIYTSANGYMFSMVNKAGEMGIRLPKDVATKFNAEHGTGAYKSHGATMRDYVHIPEALFGNDALLIDLLNQSHAYVMALPPK
jgi:hypothetical protein